MPTAATLMGPLVDAKSSLPLLSQSEAEELNSMLDMSFSELPGGELDTCLSLGTPSTPLPPKKVTFFFYLKP